MVMTMGEGAVCMERKIPFIEGAWREGDGFQSLHSRPLSSTGFDAQITVIVKIYRTILSPTRFHPLSSLLSWKKNHKVTHSIFVSEKKNRFGIALEITLEKEIGFKLIFVIQIQSLAGSFFG